MDTINKLVLGTVQFGLNYGINNYKGKPSEQDVFAILDYSAQQKINTLDTADAYGSAIELIGSYHSTHLPFNIISKFSFDSVPLKQKAEQSLHKMGISCFEAYLFHSFADFEQGKYSVHLLKELKDEKLTKKIGVSIYTAAQMLRAIESDIIDIIQLPFNLLDNRNQRGDLMEKARLKGKEIHVRSVFLQGLFFMDRNRIPAVLQPLLTYLKRCDEVAQKFAVPIQALAIQYALKNEAIDKVLFGVDSKEQLIQNLDWAAMAIPEDAFEEIDLITVKEIDLLNPVNWK